MKKIILLLIILIFFFSFHKTIKAENQTTVLINEIAWMGSTNSANDEWIELFNSTESAININGWVLKSDDGTPEIKLTGSIRPNDYYLLERTDENSVPGVSSDKIYKGSFGNDGENIILYDSNSTLIDRASFSSGWTFGNKETKQTAERINPSTWQTSQNPNGTPKLKNSDGYLKITKTNTQKENLLKPEKSDNKASIAVASLDNSQELINNINKDNINIFNPWNLFLIVGGIILVLGASIIFFKLKNK